MIEVAEGLKHSFRILNLLKRDKDLKSIEIYVRCFMNCRECGLTFTIYPKSNRLESKTFCIYEHRNSDEIIINSKVGWGGFSDQLPYKGESKYEYDVAFRYNEHEKCYLWLREKILKLVKGGKK